MISLKPSHGAVVNICSRSSYECLEKAVQLNGWRGKNFVTISEEAKRELTFFLENIVHLNGQIIQSESRAIRVSSLLYEPVTKQEVIPFFEGPISKIMVSDASDSKVFVYNLMEEGQISLSVNLSEWERSLSSGHRELLAILKTLQTWERQSFTKGLKVFWITDSENVVSFINKGSRKQHVQNTLFDIVLIARSLDLEIIPIHLRRQDPRIQLADLGSKTQDTDNWSIDNASFEILRRKFHFDFDLFADAQNKKCVRFASKFFEEGSEVIDCFSANWGSLGMLWICPPIKEAIKVARRIQGSTCKGVILIPVWPSSTFYNFFFDSCSRAKPPFFLEKLFHPYVIQNENARNTPLFGHTKFHFAVLSFNTFKS